MEINDPRLDFVMILKEVMKTARAVNGANTVFAKDPTSTIEGYCNKIKEVMCLDWIDENIKYTEECIKAPYKQQLSQNNLMGIPKISILRGDNKPNKKEYKTFEAFKEDIELIYSNCVGFNGIASSYSTMAKDIVDKVTGMENQYKPLLEELNKKVNAKYMQYDLQPIMV